MGDPDAVFKAYDIRGTVPDQLDANLCRALGAAVARFTKADRIVVVRDMRESGIGLSRAFCKGARDEGTEIVDLGMASTDFMYFASGRLDCPGAMFTASHNPAQYNGLKLCLAGARPIGQDTGLGDIKQITTELLAGGKLHADPEAETEETGETGERGEAQAGVRSQTQPGDLLAEFAVHVHSFVDVDSLAPLKVVVDTANGMGGLIVPLVMDGLPFDTTILFGELDGTFPNHPADPIQPENLADLKAKVLSSGADIGLAFDGDADRVFLVDERAETVSGSLTTALVAASMLQKHPGATVLYNLICSRVVPEVIAENGGVGVRTRVGHSFIKSVMAETGAVFGGEHSGHYYYRDNYRADSGIITALLVLELMSKSGRSLSELLAPYQRYADSGELNTEVADPAGTVDALAELVANDDVVTDRLDGLTVDHGDWWYNIRTSNTEPLLRLNLEARTAEECERHVNEVLDSLRRLSANDGLAKNKRD